MQTLLTLEQADSVFCDAFVCTQTHQLIFGSIWGRDTAVQELLARLSLPSHEGGLNYLSFREQRTRSMSIGHPDTLRKLTARMPKTNIFGDVVQLWLFDKKIQEPDFANRHAFLVIDERQGRSDATLHTLIWGLFKSVCHLPMLDRWQAPVITLLQNQHWVFEHSGFGVSAIEIKLPEVEFDGAISAMIQSGALLI